MLRLPQGIGLAQQLHIHPKALRSALRYLEQEQVVWREHRAFKRRRQGAADEEDGGDPPQLMLLLARSTLVLGSRMWNKCFPATVNILPGSDMGLVS